MQDSDIGFFKVIVAGGRDFSDYELMKRKVLHFLQNMQAVEIVSGGANGADKLGERLANEIGWSFKVFPADWDLNGKSAGYIRNVEMAKYADACVCFWDGKSRGTEHMIKIAEKEKLHLRVIKY
jgi:hypothetical protein